MSTSAQALINHTPLPLPQLPTENELPYEDGIPMETLRHRLQMELLIRSLDPWAAAQGDVFVSGNQFVYFNAQQLRGQDFRGPDVFVACGVSRRERKSWVVWEEGKAPDVVIELLSESTADNDKGNKKDIYQNQLRVADYFWLDPFNVEDRCGFTLRDRHYVPIPRDADGSIPVPSLGLRLCMWTGEYLGVNTDWLRWADTQGLLPLPEEYERQKADAERERANTEQQKVIAEWHRANAEQLRANAEQRRANIEQQRANAEQQRADIAEQKIAQLLAELENRQLPTPSIHH